MCVCEWNRLYGCVREFEAVFGTSTETSLNTSSHFSFSAQFDTLVHSAEVAACLCTPWKQGDFRLKRCAADVTRNSFYCLDNQSVNELMCHLPFLVFPGLVKTPAVLSVEAM